MALRLDEYMKQGQRADVKDDRPVSKSMRLGDFMAQERQVVEDPELIPGLYQPTEEQTSAWNEKGKIGYFEQAIRMNKKRLIPFYFGDSVKTFKTWRAVNRLTADDYKADPEARDQDIQKVNDFLELLAEENTRGFTIGGRITQGVGELPAYLTEFLATGGIASIGKQAVKQTVKKGLRTIAKSGAKKFVTRVAGGVAKATMRTAAMPHRVLESGSQKAIYAKLDFTDKGYDLLEEAREAPAISFLKGYGDVVIENFSEEAGFYLGKYANKLLPRRLTSGLAKIYKKLHPGDSIAKFLKNTRVWNGFLNEWGEERLGNFLRAVFKVEDFGAKTPESMVDRIISSWPNGEEFLIEAAVLAFPGGANMLASNAIAKYRTLTGKKTELDDMPAELDQDMPDKEIDAFMAVQAEKEAEMAAAEALERAGEAEPGVKGVGAAELTEIEKRFTESAEPMAAVAGEPFSFLDAGEDLLESAKGFIAEREDPETNESLGFQAIKADGTIIRNVKGETISEQLFFPTVQEAKIALARAVPVKPTKADVPKAGGQIMRNLTPKEQEQLKNLKPDGVNVVRLEKDVQVKVGEETKTFKAGEDIYIYQDPNTGKALVKDGEYAILPKKEVTKVEQAGYELGYKEEVPTEEVWKGAERKKLDERLTEIDTQIQEAPTPEEARRLEIEYDELSKIYGEKYAERSISADTKFSQYQLPGGENYRELVVKAQDVKGTIQKQYSVKTVSPNEFIVEDASGKEHGFLYETKKEAQVSADHMNKEPVGFKSPHWDEPNVLYHLRMNDRTVDGKKVLFVEEVQSDWARAGREKGFIEKEAKDFPVTYRDAVPYHPALKNWHEGAAKKILDIAVREGYDAVSWTTGEQQAERYDLSKQVDKVTFNKKPTVLLPEGEIYITAQKNDQPVVTGNFTRQKAEQTFGKEITKKIFEGKDVLGTLRGIDLKVGAEWAKNLYDRMLPKAMEKLTGGKVKKATIEEPGKMKLKVVPYKQQPILELTPEIKDRIIAKPKAGGLPQETPKEKLAELEERKAERRGLQEEFVDAAPVTERLKGRVRRFKKGFLAEELEAFPKGFFTTKPEALDVDEAIEEVNRELGLEIKNYQELAEILTAERERVAELRDQIEALRPEQITRQDITVIRQKIADIQRGIREGKVVAKKETKALQADIIRIINYSGMAAADKAKFIATIKNIQTREQWEKALPGIDARIARLMEAASVRSLKGKIAKELKKTKVKKQAGKPVGKYTAEVQEILDLMRQTALLTKDEAQAIIQQNIEASEGLMPSEDIRLKNELLTFTSGLDEKTPVALQTILDTIQSMKKTGKVVRRLQRMERNEDIIKKKQLVIDQVTGGKGIKPGRETVGARKTTMEQFKATMRSLGSKMILSWRGLMDTLEFNAGVENKVLADEFDTLDQDNKYKELTEDFTNGLTDAMVESYGIDKGVGLKGKISLPYKIGAKINELQQDVNLGKFKNADGKTVELIFTKDELIKKYMELKDPTLFESFRKGNKITLEMMKAIYAKLTPADRAFAQKQFAVYKKQWQKVNPIYRDLFGANLPFSEFYSPIARENFNLDITKGFGSFIHDATTRTAVTTGAFKTRVKNVLPIKTQSSIAVLERHLKETNYFVAWAKRMKVFDSVFKDANVRESISQEFTRSFLNSIDNTMNDLSTNGNRWSRRLGPVEFFRKNFTLGKLMIKPAIFAKQLVSTLAYLEKIPFALAPGVADFWLTGPLKNYKILQAESVLIRTRGANMERDIKNATTTTAVKAFTKKQNFVNLLMMNVKSGDKLAIIMGSWAMRKQRLSEKVALPDIVREYETFSAETQQSSDISRLSEVQRGGSFEKLFTMFKSSQRQYLQKELQAVKSLFQKGGTSPANIKKVAKVIAIYHVLLPVAFQYLANLGGWDDEDKRDYIRAGILGSLNGLFIFGDIMDSIIRKALKLRVFSNEVPISTIANDVMRAMGKLDWDDITPEDVVEALGELIEAGDSVGIPVTAIKNIFIGVGDIINADVKAGIAEILGWSPRVVKKEKKSGKKLIR